MNLLRNQRGSSHLVLFVAIAVIAVVGVVGYRVMNTNEPADTSSSSFSSSEPTSLKSSADVKRAENSLDNTNMDTPDQLDQDLNSL